MYISITKHGITCVTQYFNTIVDWHYVCKNCHSKMANTEWSILLHENGHPRERYVRGIGIRPVEMIETGPNIKTYLT